MSPSVRSRYRENLKSLNNMHYRSNSRGCYIATMVYGSYDHPQVLILRKFRDTFLSNYYLGKKFIKFYYKYSPGWVESMKNMKLVNQIIKSVLNKLILILRKRYA